MRPAAAALAAAAAFAAFTAGAAPPRPLVPSWDAPALTRACDAGIAAARKAIVSMERKRGAGTIFAEWNRLQIGLEDVVNPAFLLGDVHPDKAVRDAAEPCLRKYTALSTELFQNEKLFRRVQAARPANPRQAKLARDLLEGFEDSGVALPPAKRARAKEIFDRLEQLRQEYEKSVRDDPTRIAFTPAEMEGLPEAYLQAREKERDASGRYVLGLDAPSYFPFMQGARSEDARRRYYVAKLNEGGAANLERLDEMFRLRRELAGLYGLASFADYALRRRMAGDAKAVNAFLDEVRIAIEAVEKAELEALRAAKAKESAKSLAETRIHRWDAAYYVERVRRERFEIDRESLRRHFPTPKALAFVLRLSEQLYGVRFAERKVPVWHEDVRYFDVLDAKSRYLSGFYVDLFPREGKYGHAAAYPVRGASRLAGRTPLAALVTNFDRAGLDPQELETLLHEFGHVLHNVLSRTDYASHSGTSVKGDFVEAPSQMFEEWGRREQPLAVMREVCPECPRLASGDIERLDAARRFGQGLLYASQWLYAAFDMALSTHPRPSLAVWKSLEAATALGHVEGTIFPASFGHLASGYAAGYYGYMWSQVLALDMLSRFSGNLLDPKVGALYRDTILSQGGQVEEREMVRRFLGREPRSEAFFAEITGRR